MTIDQFEDFNGPAGSQPDPAYWSYDVGGGGWGNNELQTYASDPASICLDGNSCLRIRALPDGKGGYTSAKITTLGKVTVGAGTISVRAKIPTGKGIWPALWMLGTSGTWPANGEIDILETVNTATRYRQGIVGPRKVFGITVPFWPYYSNREDTGPDLSADFHTYWVRREPRKISLGIDDTTTVVYTPANIPGAWAFDVPMYFLMQIAVGGTLPGTPPDASTPWPADMLIDWVRYQPT